MNYQDTNIKYILENINMLKILKDIKNLIGSREYVHFSVIEDRLNPNKNQSFHKQIKALSQYNYLKLVVTKDDDGHVEYDKIEVSMTTEGNIVCGFIMTVLLDFHRSQQDSPRY